MNRKVLPLFSMFLVIIFTSYARCESPVLLEGPTLLKGSTLLKGIEQYKEENYEEAVELLTKARQEDPDSSAAAFFLGLAYKQIMDYPKALVHLREAVTLHPKIKEAAVELIDVSLQLNNLEEANKWIEVAEKEQIYPAKIAFLKGLTLMKEGKNQEAIESFERAEALDETLTQAAEFQIALSYINEKKLKEAKERFQAAVLHNPQTDLASFARRYQDLVDKRIFLERPLRVTLGAFGGYDTNVVLLPTEPTLAPGISDEESFFLTTNLRLDYIPILKGPWLFNAQYTFFSRFNEENARTYDVISNGIYVTPGYNFGRYALNLAVNYNLAHRRDPSFKKYLGFFNVGPLFRLLHEQNHLLELFAGYASYQYYQPALIPEEERDTTGFNGYFSWIWTFKKGAFFNFRYDYTEYDAEGINWQNKGNRFSANLTLPLEDNVKLQLSGMALLQKYENVHTVFQVKREDKILQGSLGLNWDFWKNTTLILQASYWDTNSNIAIYDYDRNILSAGIEYRF